MPRNKEAKQPKRKAEPSSTKSPKLASSPHSYHSQRPNWRVSRNEIRKMGDRGLALAHKALSELYSIPEASGILHESSDLIRQDLSIHWIPDLEHIYVKEEVVPPPTDPVLVMKIAGARFLIGAWDEPEKSRLTTLLNEFS